MGVFAIGSCSKEWTLACRSHQQSIKQKINETELIVVEKPTSKTLMALGNELGGRQVMNTGYIWCFLAGALVASVVVYWTLSKRVWPKKTQNLEDHAETRGRREALHAVSEIGRAHV